MFNKSFKKEHVYAIVIGIILIWIAYPYTFRENFVKEHFEAELENKNTNKRIDDLTSRVDSLQKEFESQNSRMQAQSQQAAAASASLQALPTGYDDVTGKNF